MKLYHINPKQTQKERRNYGALARSFQLPMFPDSVILNPHFKNLSAPLHSNVNTNFSCPTTSRSETTHASHLLHFTKAFKAQFPKFYHQIYKQSFSLLLLIGKNFSVVFKFKALYHEISKTKKTILFLLSVSSFFR